MPRKYVSIKTYKNHEPEEIKAAINYILTEGRSLRDAAKKYDIHYSVLYRHLKNGENMKKRGGQTVLSEGEEKLFVKRLQICGDWGYPIDPLTLRLLVKDYLDRQGKTVPKFKDNLPGRDFVYQFLKRHSDSLSARMCQNIKRSRAAITPETINEYFDNLSEEIKDVPPCNIVNYDETNLSDDPGRRLVITKRGCKYPERIMNATKSSISVMFAAAGDGKMLPPYVVYKATNIYDSWRVGGPPNSRYNRTKSGWFDSYTFADWMESIALPYLKKLEGVKVLIGDNLSSHLSIDIINLCQENNIKFIFLLSNSTHLTQPLDVAFFRPLKMAWRSILEKWKQGPGRNEASLAKDKFPPLLKELCGTLKETNVIAGFKKCGIVPLDRSKVLNMLPSGKSIGTDKVNDEQVRSMEAADESFVKLLKTLRHLDAPQAKKTRKKVDVAPGKSVNVSDFPSDTIDAVLSTSTGKGSTGSCPKRAKKTSIVSSTSEDESNYSLQDSDPELILSSLSEDDPDCQTEDEHASPTGNSVASNLLVGDFAVVKVSGKTKQSFRLYIAKVLEVEEDGYVVTFLKKCTKGLRFAQTEEEAFVKEEDFVRRLSKPSSRSSSRFKGMIAFNDDLSDITLY